MKAIYRGLMFWVGTSLQVCELLDVDMTLVHVVDYGDPDLIIDPTDEQVAHSEAHPCQHQWITVLDNIEGVKSHHRCARCGEKRRSVIEAEGT